MLNSSVLTAGQMEAPVHALALNTFGMFDHTVKTLCLFVCTHNNKKTLHFCKIIQAKMMCFLPSVNLCTKLCVYLCLTDIKKYI